MFSLSIVDTNVALQQLSADVAAGRTLTAKLQVVLLSTTSAVALTRREAIFQSFTGNTISILVLTDRRYIEHMSNTLFGASTFEKESGI